MKLFALLILVCTATQALELPEELAKSESIEGDAYVLDINDKYYPNWESLDKRPLPEWYHRAKVGIMIHWGVYSVPAYYGEWFWFKWIHGNTDINKFMTTNYKPEFSYQDFAPQFTAEFFMPDEWAGIFKRAGAKYVILTTKHHDGYALFPSKHSMGWNSLAVGPHRDLTKELAKAVRKAEMEFGVYYSLLEWFNPLYNEDAEKYFTTNKFVSERLLPDLMQLVTDYKPSIVWSDGEWDAYSKYFGSEDFLAWLYTSSPVKDQVVVNDRWGAGCRDSHGDFYVTELGLDGNNEMKRVRQSKKYETLVPLDKKSFGYRREMRLSDLVTIDEILQRLIITVSCGGNFVLNVGATKEGKIPLIFQESLQAVGDFLDVNGEAIYNTSCWKHQNDTLNRNVWYTCRTTENRLSLTEIPRPDKITAIYALFQKWPKSNILKVKAIHSELKRGIYQVELLGQKAILKWVINDGIVNIQLPDRAMVLTNNGWALKLSPLSKVRDIERSI